MKVDQGIQCRFILHHPGRTQLAGFLTFLAAFGTMTSMTLIIAAIVIHLSVAPYVVLLDSYDGAYLSIILAGLGVVGNIVYGWLLYLLFDVTKGEHFGKSSITLIMFGGLTIVVGIICFIHIREVTVSFRGGIHYGMKSYKNDTKQKTAIDELQIVHHCCGLKGYEDWFHLQWIDENFVDKVKLEQKTLKGVYLSDDVPFSCCDPSVFRPCIHDAVHTNSRHFNYDHTRNLTIYKDGCLSRLNRFFGPGLLFIIGLVVCVIGITNMIMSTVVRVLYTSLLSARKSGDEFGPGVGLLLPGKVEEYQSKTNLRK